MKKNTKRTGKMGLLAAAALGVLAAASSDAAPTLKYTFNDITGTTVPNTAPGATINGTLTTGGGVAPIVEDGGTVVVGGITYPLGNVVRFAPPGDGNGDANTPYIQTNGSISLWGMASNTPYTSMAWVKFNNQNGDNMVFGDLSGNRLHHGARGANYHSGNWGDDVTGGTTQPGVWHHVAWVNLADNNNAIYVDGVLTVGPGSNGTGGIEYGDNVVIGTSGNGGSLNGSVDDVKIFNTLLTPAEIQTEMTSTLIIPATGITAVSGVGSTVVNDFRATILLKDGTGVGRQVVPAQITSVTFNGANAASFSSSKTGDLTTVTAQLAGPYTPGQFVYDVHVIGTDAGATAYDIAQNVTGPILPPVAAIPGPVSGTPSLPWAVREYTTTAANAPAALGIILTNAGPSTDTEVPVINFIDPQAAGDGGDFNNSVPFPGNTPADDNHVIMAKSAVTVAGPATLSFNIRTDDGCALKITGATCTAAFGAGIDPADASTVVNQTSTNARITYTFPAAGTYDVGFMSFDSAGGGSAELSWAAGAVTSGDERQLPWALVGNPSHPSVPPTTSQWPTNLPGANPAGSAWGLRTYPNEGFENVESLAAAMTFLGQPEVACWTPTSPAKFLIPGSWSVGLYTVVTEDTLTVPQFSLPGTPGGAILTLKHSHNFEDGSWDGGVIQVSINGGVFTTIPSASFTQGAYNGTVTGTGSLLDQLAFVNNSGGAITSIASIPGANPGDQVQIRFLSTWDECCGPNATNWRIISLEVNWAGSPVYASNFSAGAGGLVSTTSPAGTSQWAHAPGTTVTRTGVVDTQAPYLNFSDPQTNGPGGVLQTISIVPANTAADDNHVVNVAHGRINITTAAEYTFNNHGDDGFLLRVRAVSGANPVFRRVSGGGQRTMSAPNEMYFPTGTGDTDTRGIIYLAAGQYDLDYVTWEGGGGYWFQLTMAQGAFIDNAGANGTDNWVPVGYMASNLAQAQPTMAFQWDVRTSAPGTLATGNNAGAEAAVASLSPIAYDFLNFTDPQTNGGGPGRFGADLPFATDTGVDDNNFAVSATGDLVILTAGEYLLGFEGDDGGYLEIAGAPGAGFSRIVENATGAATIQSVNGGTNNRLNTDVATGNSRTVGQIYLPAGEYTLKTLFFEIGGGAFYEVYGSAYSTAPINFNKASSLTLLKADASYPAGIPTVTLDAISSPALVSKPTVDLGGALPAYSFGAGNTFSVTFASSPGLVYSLEYSTDLVNWSKAGATYGSAGATTTISGLLTGLPSPLQANAPRIFFRVNGAY